MKSDHIGLPATTYRPCPRAMGQLERLIRIDAEWSFWRPSIASSGRRWQRAGPGSGAGWTERSSRAPKVAIGRPPSA